MRQHVVVIGGGVVGCATAYYLSREGVDVTLIEGRRVGCGASGYAVGLLNPLTGSGIPGPMESLSARSFEIHRQLWPLLVSQTDVDIEVEMIGHLELCHTVDDLVAGKEKMAFWQKSTSFTAEWIEPDEIHKLEPRVNREILGAVLLENVALLDSYKFTLALLKASESHGAMVVNGQVIGIMSSGGQVTGVKLNDREIGCDAVIVAMGPWSNSASNWLEVDVPVKPLKGQIIHLEKLDPPLGYHLAGPGQVVSKRDGFVWVGATEEEKEFDLELTTEARNELMDRSVKMVPSLDGHPIVRQTACLRPISPDRLPIIGPVPGLDGTYLATAAEKKGILIGPAIGNAISDLVITGETDIPIASFQITRF